jgi:hypothetical protein
MPDIIRQVLDRAGLEPATPFREELEARVDEALRSPEGADPFGEGLDPDDHDEFGRRLRRRVLLAVLASAAVIAVAVVITVRDRDRVVTTPGTVPAPTSVAPTPTATLPATVAPAPTTAVPAPMTTTPTPATSGPVVDLSSFSPSSMTFVSPTRAWALGGDCGQLSCPKASLLSSDDRGQTWRPVNPPPARLDQAGTDAVHAVRFANDHDGYAFGGALWSTHDGGASWTRVGVPGSTSGTEVVALEVASHVTHAVISAPDGFRVMSSPDDHDAWHLASIVLPYGGGPVPSAQLVLNHDAGWLLENDRVVTAGARLVNGTWSAWTPPCVNGGGPATLAASDASNVVAVCQEGIWGGPSTPETRLFASTDGGATFAAASGHLADPTALDVTAAATPAAGTVVVGGRDGLHGTFDGGRTWTTVWNATGGVTWSELGFTTKQQGVAVVEAEGGRGEVLLTMDAGHHWNPVSFGR